MPERLGLPSNEDANTAANGDVAPVLLLQEGVCSRIFVLVYCLIGVTNESIRMAAHCGL
jgi:hypothetical protein